MSNFAGDVKFVLDSLGSAQLTESAMARQKQATPDGLTKFQRYRTSQRAKGMKLLRVWVPDPRAPDFAKGVERQAILPVRLQYSRR